MFVCVDNRKGNKPELYGIDSYCQSQSQYAEALVARIRMLECINTVDVSCMVHA